MHACLRLAVGPDNLTATIALARVRAEWVFLFNLCERVDVWRIESSVDLEQQTGDESLARHTQLWPYIVMGLYSYGLGAAERRRVPSTA